MKRQLPIESGMVLVIQYLTSVVLFSLAANGLIRVLNHGAPAFSGPRYSKLALRLGRGYKIFAWGLMSGALLIVSLKYFFLLLQSAL